MHRRPHPQLSLVAKVLWAIVAGLLLAPFVIAAVGGHIPAPDVFRSLPPFSNH